MASLLAAILTEIYLCNVCSCHEILRRNGLGQALSVLRHLGLSTLRSLRVIGWTSEEMGGGSTQYWQDHDPANYSAAFESDNGVFDTRGLRFSGSMQAHAIIREIAKLLPERMQLVAAGGGGADVAPAKAAGAPAGSVRMVVAPPIRHARGSD
eukprot:COSAG01_NODE_8939_length_2608_cov_1.919091_2_plen_153_part_00